MASLGPMQWIVVDANTFSLMLEIGYENYEYTVSFFSGSYSTIEDYQLDSLIQQAQDQNPHIGIRLAKGFLRSKGHRVQRERIQASLLRTDPIGLMERWSQAGRKRKYSVPGPLSLWHIDGIISL